MATGVYGQPLLSGEGETKTLATSAGYVLVKPGFHEVKMYCASQWRLALSPALLHCFYYSASGGTYTEYKNQATDGVSTTHVPLDAMPATDYVYLGFSDPVLGVYVNVDGTHKNAEVATLDVEYCSTAVAQGATIAFTDVASDSDGTDSGGATLAIDGVYTWTLPAAWKESTLGTRAIPVGSKCWWIRFKPSATLSAEIDLVDIIPVYQNTNYMYMEAGMEYQFSLNVAKVGGFVVAATAGTPVLDISWVKH